MPPTVHEPSDPEKMTATIDIRLAEDRFHTNAGWLNARHSFNFGPHQHPVDRSHGLLVVCNEDVVAPGTGFGRHGHRDMEIVTWVLSGALEHRDSSGNHGVLTPGIAQHMSAGSGIEHSESNASQTEELHLVQMWVPPDRADLTPSYAQDDFSDRLASNELVAVASGMGHSGALAINQMGAAMWIGRLSNGAEVDLPHAPWVHVFVATGSVALDTNPLVAGDAARITNASSLTVSATESAEIIVWQSDISAT